MKTAQDLMETHVLSLSPESSLLDAVRVLSESEIHGAPVVDQDGSVLGVVSSADLVRAVMEEHDTPDASPEERPDYYYDYGVSPYGAPNWNDPPADLRDRLAQRQVDDVMTRDLIAVDPETPIPQVAKLLHQNRIHRALVLEKGTRLVGIVSLFDLLPLLYE